MQPILSWRCWLEDHQVRQPFKQAHREVYLLTDAERDTETYSNRFASHIIRQHQFASLCRERGWKFKVMGDWDSHNTPSLDLTQYNLQAKFEVESPEAEDDESTTAHGIYLAIRTGRVEFVRLEAPQSDKDETGPFGIPLPKKFRGLRRRAALRLEEIPALVFSEIMRDCDLFVGVTSIGTDPAWNRDHPDDPHLTYWQHFSIRRSNLGVGAPEGGARRSAAEARYSRPVPARWSISTGSRRDLHEYPHIHIGSANDSDGAWSVAICVSILQSSGDTAAQIFPCRLRGDRILGLVSQQGASAGRTIAEIKETRRSLRQFLLDLGFLSLPLNCTVPIRTIIRKGRNIRVPRIGTGDKAETVSQPLVWTISAMRVRCSLAGHLARG